MSRRLIRNRRLETNKHLERGREGGLDKNKRRLQRGETIYQKKYRGVIRR